MRSPYIIRSITIQNDGVAIEYTDVTKDLRANGLQASHVVFIPAGDDYDDEIENLTIAAQEALADALQDMANLEPMDPKLVVEETVEGLARQLGVEDDDEDEDDPSTT